MIWYSTTDKQCVISDSEAEIYIALVKPIYRLVKENIQWKMDKKYQIGILPV